MTVGSDLDGAIDAFWTASGGGLRPPVSLSNRIPPDRSAFRVALAAAAAGGAVSAAVSELTGRPAPAIDPALALATFTTHVTQGGRPVPKWAPLSGAYRTADDRFVQLHCNFPHHARGAARRLGAPEDPDAFATAVARWDAFALEQALIDDDMVAAAYRTLDEWADDPHAASIADLPVLDWRRLSAPDEDHESNHNRPATAERPLSGIRVLDFSRVLAGPVAGQTLANLGADVLRVDGAHLPSVAVGVMTTGTSKRNTYLDLRSAGERERLVGLVRDADVVIDAYRPGALDRWGFGPHEIAAVAPSASVVQISAFDWVGPWAGRRGFDSIVQSTTGIALAGAELSGSEAPVHLPVQALDYSTGLFAASAAIRALARRSSGHGTTLARLSLIRSRNWFVGLGGPDRFEPGAIIPEPDQLASIASDFGELELVRPLIGSWSWGPRRLGSDRASWWPQPAGSGGAARGHP